MERNRGRATKKVFQFKAEYIHSQLKRHFEAYRDEGGEEVTNYLKRVRAMCIRTMYLVTLDNGDLLLLVRYFCGRYHEAKTLHFDVFRVVYPGQLEWVRSLQDRAIFIGTNQAFSIKAADYSGVRPNSIYFTYGIESYDMGIFTLKDRIITPFNITRNKGQEKVPFLWVAPASQQVLDNSKGGIIYEQSRFEDQIKDIVN